MKMQNFNFDSGIVLTPGRTGSQIIMKNLIECFGYKKFVHTHNPTFVPATKNSVAFLSRRHNMFDSMASFFITKRTHEYWEYHNKTIEPFEIDLLAFEHRFWFNRCFYDAIDLSNYAQVIDVWYEELISNPKYLFGLLGIDQVTDYQISPKSPHDYQLILNLDQCRKWYNELTNTPVTQDKINSLRQFF